MIRSRRGDTFLLLLDLVFLTAMIFLFVSISDAFTPQNTDEPLGSHQAAMLRTYDVADGSLVRLDVMARKAAVAAIGEVARAGGVVAEDTRCGTYAGLRRWDAPDGQLCFPAQAIVTALKSEVASRLRISDAGAIPSLPYEISIENSGQALRISGVATRDVTLPILLSQSADTRVLSKMIQGSPSSTAFVGDARIAGLTARPIPGGTPRSFAKVSLIIVGTTGTADAAATLALYDRGAIGAHYLIDPDGRVTQLAREDLRVRSLLACDTATCSVKDAEDRGIAIAVVNDGQSSVTDTQRGNLSILVADIARRRAIPVRTDTVLLTSGIIPDAPTVNLAPEGQDASSWWSQEVTRIGVLVATPPVIDETPIAPGVGVPSLIIPVEDASQVSSCHGWRTINGRPDFHDGIDFPGSGNAVVAAADGVVFSVCDATRCDGLPRKSGDFGMNIIIQHDGGIFTRYSHLSEIRIVRGDRVTQGMRIGATGNTGLKSLGAHLDFKVYTSRDSIVEIGNVVDKGVEPLCFFSSDAIAGLQFNMDSGSCKAHGGPITADNEHLRTVCAGFDVQPTSVCGIGEAPITTANDPNIQRTLERLDSIPGLRARITASAIANGVDERLVLGLITQESVGDPNAISSTGCAGLGQFCMGTATSGEFADIFGPGVRKCDCKGKASCTPDSAGCAGDPRFDPFKSADAIPLHLSLDAKSFDKYTDKWRFAIASYNAGGGNVRSAIRASGVSDPTWEEVVPHLKSTGLNDAKIDELTTYVERVSGYWIAFGGDATPVQMGTTCTTSAGGLVDVREIGSYTFRPSFSIEVENSLAPLVGVSAQAKELYDRCDGRGGADPNACFVAGAHQAFGTSLVSCAAGNEAILQDFREFVADCRSSDQSGCGCSWDIPELPTGVDSMRLDLHGTDAQLVVGDSPVGTAPAGSRTTQLAALPATPPHEEMASIMLERTPEGTRASLVRWRLASANQEGSDADDELEIDSAEPLSHVLLRPDGAWMLDGDLLACAPHKREHAVCVDLGTSTRDADGVAQPLVARFAVWLQDVAVPTAPANVRAAQPTAGGYLGVTFTPSSSADISHYRIWCAPQGIDIDETKPYTLVNATESRSLVRFCNGQAVVVGAYQIRVESDSGWLSIISGLSSGFTEEDFLDALVGYYTGGTVTP